MTKILISACYGGFGLSDEAAKRVLELKGILSDEAVVTFNVYDLSRHDPVLLQVFAELGDVANSDHSNLTIVEISGNKYRVEEYDGYESIATPENQDWTFVDTPQMREKYPEDYL